MRSSTLQWASWEKPHSFKLKSTKASHKLVWTNLEPGDLLFSPSRRIFLVQLPVSFCDNLAWSRNVLQWRICCTSSSLLILVCLLDYLVQDTDLSVKKSQGKLCPSYIPDKFHLDYFGSTINLLSECCTTKHQIASRSVCENLCWFVLQKISAFKVTVHLTKISCLRDVVQLSCSANATKHGCKGEVEKRSTWVENPSKCIFKGSEPLQRRSLGSD